MYVNSQILAAAALVGMGFIYRRQITTKDQLMSKITEFADRQKARDVAIAATLDQIAAGVNDLEAKITVLVNTTKELTPEEQAALDDVESASDALVTKTGAIVADIADTSDQV